MIRSGAIGNVTGEVPLHVYEFGDLRPDERLWLVYSAQRFIARRSGHSGARSGTSFSIRLPGPFMTHSAPHI